jgi:hypothetical protein
MTVGTSKLNTWLAIIFLIKKGRGV